MATEPHVGRCVEQGEAHVEPTVIERGESLLDSLVAQSPAAPAPARVALPSGRSLVVDTANGAEVVRFESPTGQIELQVTLTPEGPKLQFKAADVQISSEGAIRMDCKRFEVRAADEVALTSGGDLKETVNGDKLSRVRGTSAALARRTLIEAKRGDVRIVGSDDVQLLAERIKLNC